eukprot:839653-Prymnesium_polylepis.1
MFAAHRRRWGRRGRARRSSRRCACQRRACRYAARCGAARRHACIGTRRAAALHGALRLKRQKERKKKARMTESPWTPSWRSRRARWASTARRWWRCK